MLQVSEIRSFVLSCSYFSKVVSKSLSGSSDSKIMIALYIFLSSFPDSIIHKHLQTSPKHLSHTTKTFSVSTILRPSKFSKFKLTTDFSFSRKPYSPARIACSAHSFPPKREPDLTPPPLHTSKQPDTVFVRYVLNSDVTHDRIESHPVIE